MRLPTLIASLLLLLGGSASADFVVLYQEGTGDSSGLLDDLRGPDGKLGASQSSITLRSCSPGAADGVLCAARMRSEPDDSDLLIQIYDDFTGEFFIFDHAKRTTYSLDFSTVTEADTLLSARSMEGSGWEVYYKALRALIEARALAESLLGKEPTPEEQHQLQKFYWDALAATRFAGFAIGPNGRTEIRTDPRGELVGGRWVPIGRHPSDGKKPAVTVTGYDFSFSYEMRLPIPANIPPQAMKMLESMKMFMTMEGTTWVANSHDEPGTRMPFEQYAAELGVFYAMMSAGLNQYAQAAQAELGSAGIAVEAGDMTAGMTKAMAAILAKGLPLHTETRVQFTGGMPMMPKAKASETVSFVTHIAEAQWTEYWGKLPAYPVTKMEDLMARPARKQ